MLWEVTGIASERQRGELRKISIFVWEQKNCPIKSNVQLFFSTSFISKIIVLVKPHKPSPPLGN